MLAHQLIQYYARSFPEAFMMADTENRYNFAEGQVEINRMANLMFKLGLSVGDRVAVVGENSTDHLLMLFAVAQTGMVLVPVNYRLAVPELDYIIKDADIKLLLVTDADSAKKAVKVGEGIKGLPLFFNGSAVATLGDWQQSLSDSSSVFTLSDNNIINESDTLIQLYTSGTTGHPKGVLLTHKNIFALSNNANAAVVTPPCMGSRELLIAPLFHVGGLCSATNALLCGGGVVLHKTFNPQVVANTLEQEHINAVFMVPAMIQALINAVDDLAARDFSHLQRIAYGAAPISESLLRQAITIFDCEFVQYFGMTETSGGTLSLTWHDHQRALNGQPELLRSCGRGLADVSVKIVDQKGAPMPVGETGEIAIRSCSNMKGYWKLDDITAKTLVDGWIFTGDAGYEDCEGYFYLRDRLKDMVITGGENVYPVEVENILSAHPAIVELAVIGVPDEQYGEALLAIVVLRAGTNLTVDELVDFGKQQLAGYKVPRQMKLVEVLPRNPSGKLLKTVLRAPYWENCSRGVV